MTPNTPRRYVRTDEDLASCSAGAGPTSHARNGEAYPQRSLTGLRRSTAGSPPELARTIRLASSRPSPTNSTTTARQPYGPSALKEPQSHETARRRMATIG